MKRIFILLLTALALLSLAACGKDVLTEPPGLKVSDGAGEVTAKRGTYSWSYADGLSWNSVEACGVHPFDMDPEVLTTDGETVALNFAVQPESLTVTLWHGQEESQVCPVSGNTLTLVEGYQVYEVTADWATEKYHGDASYVFAVEKPRELTLDDIKDIPELTVSASDRQIRAQRGTAEWEYSTGDHGCAISSDSMAVPEVGLDLPTIVTSDDSLELSFSLEPDEVTVNYWLDAHAYRNSPEEITISGRTIPIKEGGGYYEVIATWNAATNYGGEVSYGFYRIDPEFLTEPIPMTVHYGDQTFKPDVGASSWGYDDDHDGDWDGWAAELVHPLDQDYRTEPDFSTNAEYVTLEFPVEPDSISAHCWSEDCLGDFSAESEDCTLEDYQLALKPGNYIYEIMAQWSQEDCGGTVFYSFYVENGQVLLVDMNLDETFSWYRLDQDMKLTLLHQSDYPMSLCDDRCSYVVMDDDGSWYIETCCYVTGETTQSSRMTANHLEPSWVRLQLSDDCAYIPVRELHGDSSAGHQLLELGTDGQHRMIDDVSLDIVGQFVVKDRIIYYFDAETWYPMAYDLEAGEVRCLLEEKRLYPAPNLYVDSGYLWYMTDSSDNSITGVSLEDGSVITHNLPAADVDDHNFWVCDGAVYYFENRRLDDACCSIADLYRMDLLTGDKDLLVQQLAYDHNFPPELSVFSDCIIMDGHVPVDDGEDYFLLYIPLDGSGITELKREHKTYPDYYADE